MTPLFKKLNFKNHSQVCIINAPASFNTEVKAIANFTKLVTSYKQVKSIQFVMLFVFKQTEIDYYIDSIQHKLDGDVVLWMCYPKGTSKKYTCDFNRDTGWQTLGKLHLEPVRQVAIDDDWSALRFRKIEFIKTITRRQSYALTEQAKERTTQKGK